MGCAVSALRGAFYRNEACITRPPPLSPPHLWPPALLRPPPPPSHRLSLRSCRPKLPGGGSRGRRCPGRVHGPPQPGPPPPGPPATSVWRRRPRDSNTKTAVGCAGRSGAGRGRAQRRGAGRGAAARGGTQRRAAGRAAAARGGAQRRTPCRHSLMTSERLSAAPSFLTCSGGGGRRRSAQSTGGQRR